MARSTLAYKYTVLRSVPPLLDRFLAASQKLEDLLRAPEKFSSDGAMQLTEFLLRFARSSLGHLRALAKCLEKGEDPIAVAEEVERWGSLAVTLGEWVSLIESASIENAPSLLVPPLEKVVKTVEPSARILVCPEADYNYELLDLMPHLEGAVRHTKVISLPALLAGLSKSLIVLYYPVLEKDNILVHSLFGHEIGHLIFKKEGVRSYLAAELDSAAHKKAIFDLCKQISSDKSELELEVERNKLSNEIASFAEKWFEEFAADIFGVRLFGPAYTFALLEIAISQEALVYPDLSRHPPLRDRLQYAMDEMRRFDRFSDSPAIKERLKAVGSYIDGFRDRPKEEIKGKFNLTKKIVQGAVHSFRKGTGSIEKSYQYKIDTYKTEVPKLYNDIQSNILPCEVLSNNKDNPFAPANWISIINAGWLYYISSVGFPAGGSLDDRYSESALRHRSDQKRKVVELVSGGIEACLIHSRFLDDQGSLGKALKWP